MRQALRLKTHTHHRRARDLDGFRVGGVQEKHGRGVARTKAFLAHFAQQVAHVHGHITEVDLDRARTLAFVANRAVVSHVLKLFPMANADAAAGLLFVQKRLHQQRGGQNLVARAVKQVGTRDVGRTHRFAFAAAQAVLDGVCNRADVALLHDDGLVSHQAERRRIGVGQVGIHVRLRTGAVCVSLHRQRGLAHQLALVETPLWIDTCLVVGKGL